MRRLLLVGAIVLLGLPACSSGAAESTRTILVDYNHDQFATSVFGYFPQFTQVHPGDKIIFKQAWTGEAHTVTMGTVVDELGKLVKPYFTGEKPIPEGDPPEVIEASKGLPSFFGRTEINQTAAQPCFLRSGSLPDGGKACPRVLQPAFTGRETFYNSGFIPYEGNNGNKFTMTLAKSIAPGEYYYYCLIHGAGMAGWLTVKPKSEAIPSNATSKAASKEIRASMKDFTAAYDSARSGKADLPPSDPKPDILAGTFTSEKARIFGFVDEFVPKRFTAKVGQKVTWFIAAHTVSFKVPKYGPQLRIDPKTHVVTYNKQAYDAVGVSIPEPPSEDEPPPPTDGGTYDGSKFLSTGVQGGLVFSLTFTKAGTYQYACAVHPRMVGTLVVKA
jgi:plastocyanin